MEIISEMEMYSFYYITDVTETFFTKQVGFLQNSLFVGFSSHTHIFFSFFSFCQQHLPDQVASSKHSDFAFCILSQEPQ